MTKLKTNEMPMRVSLSGKNESTLVVVSIANNGLNTDVRGRSVFGVISTNIRIGNGDPEVLPTINACVLNFAIGQSCENTVTLSSIGNGTMRWNLEFRQKG